jgi:hypothetical protein
MSREAELVLEGYLSNLRSELVAAGAPDADDLVAEVRSLVTEAAGDDTGGVVIEIERLGDAAELARGILAERGLDASEGVRAGVWWRLGIAAPLDLAVGVSLPLAAALPIYAVAAAGEPRMVSIAMAVVLTLAVLAWPFFLWRPWRRGGRTLTPGMALTGLAVVRAPGFWRLTLLRDLEAMGLAPRRRIALSTAMTLVAAVLLAGAIGIGFDAGGTWLAKSAINAEYDGRTIGGGNPIRVQLSSTVEQVYIGLMDADGPTATTALAYVTPEADLASLWQRIRSLRIRSVKLDVPVQVAPGVYRVDVREYADGGATPIYLVGTSTFTLGHRQWRLADGAGEDWAVVGIVLGATLP